MDYEMTRRLFLKISTLLGLFISLFSLFFNKVYSRNVNPDRTGGKKIDIKKPIERNLGVNHDGFSNVYMARNGTPEENMRKVIEMMGGIDKIIGRNDIIILKPNAMWTAFRITNTNAIKQFIQMVLDTPNFSGEIILAENNHQWEDNSRGWTTTEKNGDYNLNELIKYFNSNGHSNVTKSHWRDAGPNPWNRDGAAGWGTSTPSRKF